MAIEIIVCEPLKQGELYAFYKRNNICEEGYGEETSELPLKHEGVWITAYDDGELIGFARALYDGLHGMIMEVDLDLRFQSRNDFYNGCFIETDPHGIAKNMATALLKELRRRGCHYFSSIVYQDSLEKDFFRSLGFRENTGHVDYTIDARPYVPGGLERGKQIDAEEGGRLC